MKFPRIALVYDRVNTPHGGAEKVLLAVHQAFPDAPLYTAVYDASQAKWASVFEIRPSFLQKFPFATKLHRWLAPLMPLAFESFNLDEFEVVISITSAEAKGVITKPHQLHICYLLTPTRYLYSHRREYLSSLPGFPLLKEVASEWLDYLTWWDQVAAERPDKYIPISKLVGQRCQEYYRREPEPVIYPPVEHDSLKMNAPKVEPYYLVISRLVPYKRIDLAIQACIELKRKLIIVGDGPERARLEKLASRAGDLILFLGNQPQTQVSSLLQQTQGLLMPGLEDFGITALEAIAVGRPAVVYHQSGVAEIITDGKTGIHLNKLTVDGLVEAMKELEAKSFDSQHLVQSVRKYATTTFVQNMQTRILEYWKQFTAQQKGSL
jgi:glycosyltransferase involved in cell wall biosynthesis